MHTCSNTEPYILFTIISQESVNKLLFSTIFFCSIQFLPVRSCCFLFPKYFTIHTDTLKKSQQHIREQKTTRLMKKQLNTKESVMSTTLVSYIFHKHDSLYNIPSLLLLRCEGVIVCLPGKHNLLGWIFHSFIQMNLLQTLCLFLESDWVYSINPNKLLNNFI